MKITRQQYEQIQRYLAGEMPPEEEQDFEQQLATDPVIREHVLFEQELKENLEYIQQEVPGGNKFDDPFFIRGLIKAAGRQEKQEHERKNGTSTPEIEMATGGKTLPETRVVAKPAAKVISFTLLVNIAAAACVISVLVLPFLFRSPDPGQDTAHRQKVEEPAVSVPSAETAHTAPPVVPPDTAANRTTAGAATTPDIFEKHYRTAEALAAAVHPQSLPDLLRDPVRAYQKAQYGPIQKFDPDDYMMMGAEDEQDYDKNSNQNILEWGRFYRGLSYIKTGDHNKAARDLKWVITNARNNGQLVVKAQLLLALVHIKQKNSAQAIPLLTKISNNNRQEARPYKIQAKVLLEEIKP